MAVVQTLIGNVKGPQGDTGATGATGAQGDAATIEVGSVTTAAYGTAASVTNSGTSGAAVFDFVIPQGAPGEQVTDMQNLTLGAMTTSSAEFPTPTVGETGKVIFGKINKWFSDMAALVATKFNTANVVNNLTTTSSGYALDARQGKALGDDVAALKQLSLKRTAVDLSTDGVTSVSGLQYYMFGIFYGIYANNAYPFPFDVDSLDATKHQMFASATAYCDVYANKTANTITVSNNHGFTRLVVVLYRYG